MKRENKNNKQASGVRANVVVGEIMVTVSEL